VAVELVPNPDARAFQSWWASSSSPTAVYIRPEIVVIERNQDKVVMPGGGPGRSAPRHGSVRASAETL
jgi:hypothetical protein